MSVSLYSSIACVRCLRALARFASAPVERAEAEVAMGGEQPPQVDPGDLHGGSSDCAIPDTPAASMRMIALCHKQTT
jgi:hypothetical protein